MNRVAVVIPLYNHERYIRDTLRSVLGQTHPPDRIIVVDDGSTDGSLAAARSVDSPLLEVHTQPNQGAHSTLNRAIQLAADCDVVAVLNSDDLFARNRLELCLRALETRPGVSLLCTGLEMVDEHGGALPESDSRRNWALAAWSLFDSGRSLPEQLGVANYLATTSNFVARREWLTAHPFRAYRFAHDYFALVTAALEDRLAVIPDKLLHYRAHPANTINTRPANLIREMLEVHLDLAAWAGPRALADPAFASRWAGFLCCSFANISALRPELAATLLACAVASFPDADRARCTQELERNHPDAFASFPNTAAVKAWGKASSLIEDPGLFLRLDSAESDIKRLKQELMAAKAARRLQSAALACRWFALGRFLGAVPKLHVDGDVAGQHAALFARLRDSHWLQLGSSLGFRSAKKINEILKP